MRPSRPMLAAAFLALFSLVPAIADDLSYSVGNYSPANITIAGDGTVFVEYDAPQAGATYTFTMYVWVESGHAATPFPTPNVPIQFMRLSGYDATGWFSASPSPVSFTGYGTDPTPDQVGAGYTGVPGGSYQPVTVSLSIPANGLPADHIQVKVKGGTQGIPHLGEGPGVIVRFMQSAGGGNGGGGGGGNGGDGGDAHTCPPGVTAYLTGPDGTPMADD